MMARDIKCCFVGVFLAFVFVSNVNGQTLNVQALTNGLTVEEKRQMLASLRQTLSRIRAARQNLNTNTASNTRQAGNTVQANPSLSNNVRQPANIPSRPIQLGPPAQPRQPATGFPSQPSPSRSLNIQSQPAQAPRASLPRNPTPVIQSRRPGMGNARQAQGQRLPTGNSQLFLQPNPQIIPQRNVQLTVDGNPQTGAQGNPQAGQVRNPAGSGKPLNNIPTTNRNMIQPRNRVANNLPTNPRRPVPQTQQAQQANIPKLQGSPLSPLQAPGPKVGPKPGPRMFPKQLPPPSDPKAKTVGISVQVKRKTEVKKIPGPNSPAGPSAPRVPPKINSPGSVPSSANGQGNSMVQPNSPVPTAPSAGQSRSPAMTSSGQRPVPTSPARASGGPPGPRRTTMMRTPPTQPPVVTLPRFIRWETMYPSGQMGMETAEALSGQRLVLVTADQVPMYDEFYTSSTLMDFNRGIAAIRVDMPSSTFMPTTTQVCFTMKNSANMRDTKKELLRRSKSKIPVEHGEVIHMVAAASNIQNAVTLQRTAGPFISKFCEMALLTNNVYKLVPEAPIEPGPQTISVSGLITALDPGRSIPVNIALDTAIDFFGPNRAVTSPP